MMARLALLADVAPPGLGFGASDLFWLLPPAGLLLGLWLGARARRGRDTRRRDD